jgi:hypothetical protein
VILVRDCSRFKREIFFGSVASVRISVAPLSALRRPDSVCTLLNTAINPSFAGAPSIWSPVSVTEEQVGGLETLYF